MKACIQRVSEASVTVAGDVISQIELGLLVLLGVEDGDTEQDAKFIADKLVGMRIFNDAEGKMNLSVEDVDGELLIVSQFTLCGDCRKGRRPSFIKAAEPTIGNQLYERVVELVRSKGRQVGTGSFGADMDVRLCNQGPVTIILESP